MGTYHWKLWRPWIWSCTWTCKKWIQSCPCIKKYDETWACKIHNSSLTWAFFNRNWVEIDWLQLWRSWGIQKIVWWSIAQPWWIHQKSQGSKQQRRHSLKSWDILARSIEYSGPHHSKHLYPNLFDEILPQLCKTINKVERASQKLWAGKIRHYTLIIYPKWLQDAFLRNILSHQEIQQGIWIHECLFIWMRSECKTV